MQPQDQPETSEDFFEQFLSKKIKSVTKKLKEIESLESVKNLKAEQLKKLESKSKLLDDKSYYYGIKNLYKQAENENSHHMKQEVKSPNKHPISSIPNTSQSVFDLVYLSQLYLQTQFAEDLNELQKNNSYMKDLETLYHFYSKIFTKPNGITFFSNEQLEKRYSELDLFVKKDKNFAFEDVSYSDLNDIIEKCKIKKTEHKNSHKKNKEKSLSKSPLPKKLDFKSPEKKPSSPQKKIELEQDKVLSPVKSEKKEENKQNPVDHPNDTKEIKGELQNIEKKETKNNGPVKKNNNFRGKGTNNFRRNYAGYEVQYVVKQT